MKILQNAVEQIREVINADIGVIDETGVVLACSNENMIGKTDPNIEEILQYENNFLFIGDIGYHKVYLRNKLDLIVFIKCRDIDRYKYLSLIALHIGNLKACYDEKYDKENFIKNILLDNILPGDILLKAKELHLANDINRVVMLIKIPKTRDTHILDVMQSLFPNKSKDFVIMLDDESIVLIKELRNEKECKEVNKIAKVIVDTLNTELMIKVNIGIGTIVDNIRDIGRSFKEAKTALLVGGIFENDKTIVNYNSLGIGRLIYQLPPTLCKLFLDEVFKNDSFETFDQETFITIQKFFENNLNISEASRQLYIHRNTLEYRLKKIEKATGLDLKKFDDAIILKVALMVKKYLNFSGSDVYNQM